MSHEQAMLMAPYLDEGYKLLREKYKIGAHKARDANAAPGHATRLPRYVAATRGFAARSALGPSSASSPVSST